jgi:cell division protease FtsH
MGGRIAEELFCEDVTSGAAMDLKQATAIARSMVCHWGMSESLGPQAFGQNEELMFLGREVQRTQDYSEDTAQKIDAEVNGLLTGSYDRAKKIIEKNRDKLEMIAQALLERETIEGYEVEEIVELGRVLSEDERAAKEAKTPTEPAKSEPAKAPPDAASDDNPGLETGPGQPDFKPASGIS